MNTNVYNFDSIKLDKRKSLLAAGELLYPYSYDVLYQINNIILEVEELENTGKPINFLVQIAGRVWSKRKMGKSLFLDIKDDTNKIQLYANKNKLSEQEWNSINLLDLGDIIGIRGEVFRTRKGELSIRISAFEILSKTVVPIPIGKQTGEKTYNQLSDVETKYRERYLHWMLNSKDKEKISLRFKIISEIRNWMISNDFIEVTTPNIEFVYGGAEARPFKTKIWALNNQDAFLRISPELYLKRFIVAGFPKVFTICQNYRNEGIDYSHNPEFTMIEWYEAFTDYNFQMKRFENLISSVCEKVHGTTKITYQGIEIDFTTPWKRLTMIDALKLYINIDANNSDVEVLKLELEKREIEFQENITWGVAVAKLFEETCEENLIQPTFITDHPVEISPLTKIKRGNNRLVERFEPFVCKMEIGNAYSELTDPVVQLERFMQQKEMQAFSDNKRKNYTDNPIDADFIKAIGCGMPPTGGVGIGIDRIVMLLTDTKTIRDIIPFPMVKPKN